ncbi:MAG TPA: lysyl oxidase family protein [Candidatus Paceibacterota bacterium]|nr:lysyl oxidase family protein [Candidatus Paceibacterota bacterium]
MQIRLIRIAIILLIPIVLFSAYYTWGYSRDVVPEPLMQASAITSVQEFVDTTDPNDLVPDLVPLPARDLKVQKDDEGKILLYFSTTYYNQGRGPIELRVDDPETDVHRDVNRTVTQRIHQKDGGYRDDPVGTFEWHQEHLHYHFKAFVEFDLQAVDAPNHEDLAGSRIKSTFCLRDVSRVDLDLPNREEEAQFDSCSKKLQGVSVGWGDTYYWDYPAQNIDVSSLNSGVYRFVTRANPEVRLEEINYENNISSVVFKLDMENLTVEVLEETPRITPEVEHLHLEDPFGM